MVFDSVGLALLVVLQALPADESLAFVLHDMFAMPFDDVGAVLGRSSLAQALVTRARGRLQGRAADRSGTASHIPCSRSRATGVDVITGTGLSHALTGVDCIIDVATGPSPDQQAATEFFTTAARNLNQAGERAGVQRMIVVSIIGTDRFTAGYNAAKLAHEHAIQSGPIPARILRAAQFHEFVAQLVDWGPGARSASCRRCERS